MRYGENPHQSGVYYGDLNRLFEQLNGKELSYNNLVDVDAAIQLIREAPLNLRRGGGTSDSYSSNIPTGPPSEATEHSEGWELRSGEVVFAIIKHTNVCGIAHVLP